MKAKKNYLSAICFLVVFVLWTIAVCVIDVQPIGPSNTSVGLASINSFFHKLTGENLVLYDITDILGIVPFIIVFGFMILGLIQLIRRKSLLKVDRSILILGGFYIIVFIFYILFEKAVINYRPLLIEGKLEASYPSSTTMLVLCVIPTAIIQFNRRIKNIRTKKIIAYVLAAFTAFMLVGRLISGVHWLTDIIGGILLSEGLVSLYRAMIYTFCGKKAHHNNNN